MTTLATNAIGRFRRALSGAWSVRGAFVLATVVLAVQFGLVQHSIEHWGAFPEAGCEVCVAGAHHVPVVAGAPVVPEVQAFVEDGLPPVEAYAPGVPLSAHRARAPPVIS